MRRNHSARDLDESREYLLWFAQRQQVVIESAWSDAVGAYAELKGHSL